MTDKGEDHEVVIDIDVPTSCRRCLFNEFWYRDDNHMFVCYILNKTKVSDCDTTKMMEERHIHCPLHEK